MSDLHLDSLEIKNFRCFEHLVIPKLGRVNLIVGKNSVGKTCLLEALLVYTTKADPTVIQRLLKARDEILDSLDSGASRYRENIDSIEESISYLFYGREIHVGETFARIGGNQPTSQIEFGLDYYVEEQDKSGQIKSLRALTPSEYLLAENAQLRLSVNYDGNKRLPRSLRTRGIQSRLLSQKAGELGYIFIPTVGLDNNRLADLWDNIALTELEQESNQALQIIDKSIQKYAFLKEPPYRYPVVKLEAKDKPIPLRSLGEGLTRSLGIALGLANAANGLLLIDEFETGLHHGIQADLWRLVFRLARTLNLQVFATTHSWDCVEAFQQAATEDQNEEAMLIRLQRKRDGTGIEAINYDERRLAIATRQSVEVR